MKSEELPEPPANFAEREWAATQRTKNEPARKSPLFLRLLKPGRSDNPYWNVARKIEYLLTLPLRLPAALIAAPLAIHNRPLRAFIGFLALFGFWEIWESFAKQPVVNVYAIEQGICSSEVWIQESHSMGHVMACRAEAVAATARFFWRNTIRAVLTKGLQQAVRDFDQAFEDEQKLSWNEASRVVGSIFGTVPRPLPMHSLSTDNTGDVTPDPPKQDDGSPDRTFQNSIRLTQEEDAAATWRAANAMVEEVRPDPKDLKQPRVAPGEAVAMTLRVGSDEARFIQMTEAEAYHLQTRPEELPVPLYMSLGVTRMLESDSAVYPVILKTAEGLGTYVHAEYVEMPGTRISCILVRLPDRAFGLVTLNALH